ncbi:hypothetical protein FQR65_LT20950 [Abscondita terminalis]|nr:hypothetical protein FQR65_LT20950 [Abscondita terminalis]
MLKSPSMMRLPVRGSTGGFVLRRPYSLPRFGDGLAERRDLGQPTRITATPLRNRCAPGQRQVGPSRTEPRDVGRAATAGMLPAAFFFLGQHQFGRQAVKLTCGGRTNRPWRSALPKAPRHVSDQKAPIVRESRCVAARKGYKPSRTSWMAISESAQDFGAVMLRSSPPVPATSSIGRSARGNRLSQCWPQALQASMVRRRAVAVFDLLQFRLSTCLFPPSTAEVAIDWLNPAIDLTFESPRQYTPLAPPCVLLKDQA